MNFDTLANIEKAIFNQHVALLDSMYWHRNDIENLAIKLITETLGSCSEDRLNFMLDLIGNFRSQNLKHMLPDNGSIMEALNSLYKARREYKKLYDAASEEHVAQHLENVTR